VRAVIVDAPEALCRELKITGMLGSATPKSGVPLAPSDLGDPMQKLLSSHQARTTEFPIMDINVGERVKIDKQKPLKYPTAFTQDGKPTDYKTRRIGRLIEIDLKSVTNGMADFSYRIEDVADPEWTSYKTGAFKIKQPVFHVRSTSAEITRFLNSWVIGVIPQLKDDTERITIFGIQVRETKNPQPTNAPYSSPVTGSKR
jgi:hypothetical protein